MTGKMGKMEKMERLKLLIPMMDIIHIYNKMKKLLGRKKILKLTILTI